MHASMHLNISDIPRMYAIRLAGICVDVCGQCGVGMQLMPATKAHRP